MRDRQRHRILVIDDERQTVSAVKHLLRRKYKVLGATRAQEGLDLLEDQDVAAVICDQRMPEMTGDQFFKAVREEHPRVVRIMMTAYSDMQALARSINEGNIFAYLAKPFTAEQLERVVETAVRFREVVDSNDRMTQEISQANAELSRMNEDLRAYTHVIAHDLKEPLRTITAYAGFMREDCPLDKKAADYLSRIESCSDHMQTLIDALSQYSALDQTPAIAPVPLDEVVEASVALLDAAIRDSGAEITVPSALPTVIGDRSRLILVFQNLIANGIKFNDSGAPRIIIRASGQDEMAQLSVQDNGIGIADEFHDHIFGIFERLHRRTDYPGTGTGLAIVRRVIENHGGTVEVRSAPGAGSTFDFTLRRA